MKLPPEKDRLQTAVEARHFLTTHWSLVLMAGQGDSAQAGAALETLCRSYWYPLYAFVRRQGHNAHDAQDLTQEFFARLLENDKLRLAERERGRFRSFLLASLKHFLVNEWVSGQAQKRGGGRPIVSLDEAEAEVMFRQEPASGAEPENLYDKRWAVTVLENSMDRLEADYALSGKESHFARLKPWLMTEATNDTCRALAGPLGMTEGAVKVALHRLRQRFGEAVRREIAQTVATPEEMEDELRCLMSAMSG